MRLATANRKIEEIKAFKDILSDLINGNEGLDNIIPTPTLPPILPSEKSKWVNSIRQTSHQKKKATL